MKPVTEEDPQAQAAQALARYEVLRASNTGPQDGALALALEELGASLEELRVSTEAERDNRIALNAARQALADERTSFQMLFEFAPDGYLVTDPLGVVLRANRMAGELLGVPRGFLVGKPMSLFVGLRERIAFRSLLQRLAEGGGRMYTFESVFVARGGRSFDASIRVATGGKELRWSVRDVTEQRRTEERLSQSEDRYRKLSAHLQESIEAERARISREVHDELGAALTAIRFELSALRSKTGGDTLTPMIDASVTRVDEAIRSTRRICSQLRPSLLDHMGLWAAIEWMVEDVASPAGINSTVTLSGAEEIRQAGQATGVFRIVQEAVTNVVRHANASSLRVAAHANGGEEILIEVSDDGCGIPEAALSRPDAFGIIGMQERARACGGHLVIERGASGTRVRLHVARIPEDSCAS